VNPRQPESRSEGEAARAHDPLDDMIGEDCDDLDDDWLEVD